MILGPGKIAPIDWPCISRLEFIAVPKYIDINLHHPWPCCLFTSRAAAESNRGVSCSWDFVTFAISASFMHQQLRFWMRKEQNGIKILVKVDTQKCGCSDAVTFPYYFFFKFQIT